jgi:hypothetical protein
MPKPDNESEVKALIDQALSSFFENNPNSFNFTEATGQTEWNLAHHLAPEIHKLLPDLDYDLDVTKHVAGNRRPDIIFHTIGTFRDDFLVIELKFEGSRRAINADKRKIRDYWFPPPLNYRFGSVINLFRSKTAQVEILVNQNYITPTSTGADVTQD